MPKDKKVLFKKTLIFFSFFLFFFLTFFLLYQGLFFEKKPFPFFKFLIFLFGLLFSSLLLSVGFRKRWSFFFLFLGTLIFFLIFLPKTSKINYLIFGFLAFFLSGVLALSQKETFEKIFLKIPFFYFSSRVFSWFLLGFSVFLAILIFLSPKGLEGKIHFPKRFFDYLWPSIERKLGEFLFPKEKETKLGEMTVDEFLIKNFEKNLPKSSVLKEKKVEFPFAGTIEIELGKEMIEKLKKDYLRDGRKKFSELSGKEIKGNEKMKDVIYWILNYQIVKNFEKKGKEEKNKKELLGSVSIIFLSFVLIRGFFSLLCLLYLPLAWIFFEFLKKIKFLKIKKEKTEKEIIVL